MRSLKSNKNTKQTPRRNRNRNITSQVKKVLMSTAEKKRVDNAIWFSAPDAAISTTGFITDLGFSSVSQGTGQYQRVGLSIQPKVIHFNGTFYVAPAFDGQNVLRLIFFRWNLNEDDSYPGLGSILFNGAYGGANTTSTYSWLDLTAYTILYDTTLTVQSSGKAVQDVHVHLPITWDLTYRFGTTHPVKGNVFMLALSDSNATPHPVFVWSSSCEFVDI